MRKPFILISLMFVLALTLVACGGDNNETNNDAAAGQPAVEEVAAVEADPSHGEELYMTNCIACHGADATGVPGLGKTLLPSDSEFIRTHSDAELVEFVMVGRQPDDPLNSTGVAMPPKGGSPALSESDIADIIAYIRTLE